MINFIFVLISGGISPEDGEILVTGASGGVGSIAVILLSELGYKVTAVTGKSDTKVQEMLTNVNRVLQFSFKTKNYNL